MAVVKKHQTGGAIQKPTQSYQDFIASKLASEKFTKKGEKVAREVASNFVNLFNTHDIKDVYNYDPIKEEYQIDTNKITDPTLKGTDWSGSKDSINKNIFGQFSGRRDRSNINESDADKKKFNSLLAN